MAPVTAMILGAGLGTRLRPLTELVPKPLLPVGRAPLLTQLVQRLRGFGMQKIIINTHHLPEKMEAFVRAQGGPLELCHEAEILGTAGGIAAALPRLQHSNMLLHNGDIWLPNLNKEHLVGWASAEVWLGVAPCAVGEGTVGIGAQGEVVRLRSVSTGEEVRGARYLGVAGLGADLCSGLPDRGCLMGDFLLPALVRGMRIGVRWIPGPWRDIGSPSGYLAANLDWLDHENLNEIGWIDPSSTVSDEVFVRRSCVGAGAQVRGSGPLDECVVWPGAVAYAPLKRAVVTPEGVVDVRG